REFLSFGVFAPLAMIYAASLWQADALLRLGIHPMDPVAAGRMQDVLAAGVAGTCLAGVVCSVLIYHATRRRFWSASSTGFKFGMTVILLGLSTTITTFLWEAARLGQPRLTASVSGIVPSLALLLAMATLLKLGWELLFLRHLGDKQHTE